MDVPLSTKSRCHGWLLSFEVIVAASFFFFYQKTTTYKCCFINGSFVKFCACRCSFCCPKHRPFTETNNFNNKVNFLLYGGKMLSWCKFGAISIKRSLLRPKQNYRFHAVSHTDLILPPADSKDKWIKPQANLDHIVSFFFLFLVDIFSLLTSLSYHYYKKYTS